ncbi:hypothetical protein dsmv_2848 [Desulfococcus multivorans DSM 2059]|uniref:Uncharacterized protein n=1 Tax=Desulfococcus multivorans DSM 2059 TaxID=1121405 RepID=S7TPP3_DESML|nr:hypothetical protein dsmv_2848 [Desulfococcus multivorans DSM 2059]SKA26671.1 hypothetical protein SAMN02745446_03641 [Desulfococcus multivorans DSM 2059]
MPAMNVPACAKHISPLPILRAGAEIGALFNHYMIKVKMRDLV